MERQLIRLFIRTNEQTRSSLLLSSVTLVVAYLWQFVKAFTRTWISGEKTGVMVLRLALGLSDNTRPCVQLGRLNVIDVNSTNIYKKFTFPLYYSVAIYRGRREADLPERAPGRLDVVLLQGADHPIRGVELDQAR